MSKLDVTTEAQVIYSKKRSLHIQLSPLGSGFLLMLLALIIGWYLLVIHESVQSSCNLGGSTCFFWQVIVLLLGLTLLLVSIFSNIQFEKIPNASIPPEKALGKIASYSTIVLALIIIVSSLINIF